MGPKRNEVPGNWRKVHNEVKGRVRPVTGQEAPEGEKNFGTRWNG